MSRGDDRREAILEAATELFLKHGYEGTSLDMVIARAGGSRRTVYERFGNKEGLFAAVVEDMLDKLLAKLSQLDWAEGAPQEVLTRIGTAFIRALVAPRAVALFRIVIGEVSRFPKLGTSMFERGPERAYAQVGKYISAQVDGGTFKPVDPDLAARQLLEMIKGDMHLRALLGARRAPSGKEIERHVSSAVATFLNGAAV
ncbi:MAG: TetR/AcrR family transcriptional regulator [Pseudomonadota bacterium]